MALEGSLSDFGLADILQLIYFQRKTGILTLEGNRDKVSVMFIEGNVAGAESRRRVDDGRLGKILVKKGILKEADLRSALDEQRKSGAKLGTVLIRLGLVPQNALADILGSQITDTVLQLFGWKQGTYAFAAQAITQDKDVPIALDTQHILMEGLRVVDEWAGSKEKIGLEAVFARTSADASELAHDEAEIYQLVDGDNDVGAIIDLSGRESFAVSQTLISLRQRGFIQAVSAAPVRIEHAVEEARRPSVLMGYLAVAAIALSFVLTVGAVFVQHEPVFATFRAAGRLEDLRHRIETYRIEHGSYPSALEQVAREPDPWGRPFVYHPSEKAFALSSSGPDGAEGTADDLY